MIILIIIGVVLGVIVAFPVSKTLIKRHKKKIVDSSVEKILKQGKGDFRTLQGKPIDLKFVNDGKEVDLKQQVIKELAKSKIKEIKKIKENIKKIKKSKKKIKVSGSFKKKRKHGKRETKN